MSFLANSLITCVSPKPLNFNDQYCVMRQVRGESAPCTIAHVSCRN